MQGIADILRQEHGLIRRAITCLERAASDTLEQEELRVVTALDLLEFFEDYADLTHQAKEERCLFPALLAQGCAKDRVSELLHDHEEESALLRSARRHLEGAAYGSSGSCLQFAEAAMNYAALQREHADEEDRVLIPLIEEHLDAKAQSEVLQGFRKVEAKLLPKAAGYYDALVSRVAKRLGPAIGADAKP